jgi:hypothetical protein
MTIGGSSLDLSEIKVCGLDAQQVNQAITKVRDAMQVFRAGPHWAAGMPQE